MNKHVSQHATRHLLATCYIVVSVVTWTFSKGLKLVWRLPTITQLKLTLSPWTYIYWTDSSKSTWCLRSTKTIRLIRDGEKEGVWRWGEREIIYLSLHCHHQNDFCMKVGSDEIHFNVL